MKPAHFMRLQHHKLQSLESLYSADIMILVGRLTLSLSQPHPQICSIAECSKFALSPHEKTLFVTYGSKSSRMRCIRDQIPIDSTRPLRVRKHDL